MPSHILAGHIGCSNKSAPHAAAVSSGSETYNGFWALELLMILHKPQVWSNFLRPKR